MQHIFVKKIVKKISAYFFLISCLVLDLSYTVAKAALTCPEGTEEKAGICVPKNDKTGLLGSSNLVELIKNIINILLYIGGAIAVLFVIIGGYQYLTSGGNEEAAEKGRKTVTNAVIGIILMAMAFTIINVVVGTVGK